MDKPCVGLKSQGKRKIIMWEVMSIPTVNETPGIPVLSAHWPKMLAIWGNTVDHFNRQYEHWRLLLLM